MININILKQHVQYLANKSQTGASISPNEFNLEIPLAVYFVIRRILGLPEEYDPQIPITQMGYEKTQLMTEYVDALKVSDYAMNVSALGKCTLPSNYLYISDLYSYHQQQGTIPQDDILNDPDVTPIEAWCGEDEFGCGDPCDENVGHTVPIPNNIGYTQTLKTLKMRTSIEVLTSKEYTSRQQHSLRVPTLEYPIATFSGEKVLQITPQNIKKAYITYIKRPTTPVWGYTINPTTLEAEYNPATSVNIDLPEELTDMVAANMLTRLGYSVRETELYQIGKTINGTGS